MDLHTTKCIEMHCRWIENKETMLKGQEVGGDQGGCKIFEYEGICSVRMEMESFDVE